MLGKSDKVVLNMLSVESITRLIKCSHHLEVLELHNVTRLSRRDFVAMLCMLEQDDAAAMVGNSMHALRKIDLRVFPYVIFGR